MEWLKGGPSKPRPVIVDVNVNVGGPVIVAVHVHGNAPVSVIEGQELPRVQIADFYRECRGLRLASGPACGSKSKLRSPGIRLIQAVVGRGLPTGR